MSRSLSSLPFLPLLLLVLLLLLPSRTVAHVEFSIATDTAGDDGFLTFLKIPHGCVLFGPDDGDAPETDIEAPTSSVSLSVPAEIPEGVPGVVPFWTLTRTFTPSLTVQGGNVTTFTYVAQSGYELAPWQAMAIPFVFTLPSPTVDTAYYFPTQQNCTGGYTVNWTQAYNPLSDDNLPPHPIPSIVVLGTGDPPTPSGVTTIIQGGGGSSTKDDALSITAIVLAGLVFLGALACLAWTALVGGGEMMMGKGAGGRGGAGGVGGGNDRAVQLSSSYAAHPGTPDQSKLTRV